MSPTTAADWRRRARAYQMLRPPPDDDEEGGSTSQVTTDLADIGSRDATTRDLTESQLAGLAAMIGLATAATPSGPPPPAMPDAPQAEPPASPPGSAASAAPPGVTPDIPVTTAVPDQPVIPAPHPPGPSGGPSSTGAEADPGPKRAEPGERFAYVPVVLLVAILTVEALLSLRLVWSNTAFLDEATYLYGGHVEIEHWLHGTPVPPFATYFSGAPVIYPPLAALAASAGGLAAARLLSLAFVLGATGLLWSITSKLFGTRAAFFAAALFAVLGPTQVLGALATYDAMALFLLAGSAWCAVSAQDRDDSTLLLVAGTLLLVLANATKYATAVLDPAVIALAAITIVGRRGVKPGFTRGGHLAAGTLGLVSALLALGGPWYLSGVLSAAVSRTSGSKPADLVFLDTWKWCGLVCVIAGLGVVYALRRRDRVQLTIVAVLAASGALVPLDEVRLHTATSLFRQVDFGAWFAAAAAGFAIAQLSGTGRRTWLRVGAASLAGAAAVVFAGIAGRPQASSFFQGWPNSAQTTAALRPLIQEHPGNFLAEDYNVPAYYLENSVSWQQWSQTWYFTYTSPNTHRVLSGAAAYQAAIDDGYFSLVILDFIDTAGTDSQIIADMRHAGTYHLVAVVPFQDKLGGGQVTVWAYESPHEFQQGYHGNR